MLARTTLTIVSILLLGWAMPLLGQPVPDAIEVPDGQFSISPSNPDLAGDPAAFALNDPLMPLGFDPGDRMTMPVRIGGGGPYHFVIDTGSQRTIIATELARHLALPALPPVDIISMAGPATVPAVELEGLQFGDHAITQLAVLSISRADMGGLGIIGLDSLRDKRLTMDFARRRMEVSESRRAPMRVDSDMIVVRAKSKFGQLILVNSRVDGAKVNVILDTGAEFSIGNMALFRSLKLKRLVIPPQPTTITSVTGVDVPAQFTVVRRLSIGKVSLDNVPMVFLDAAPFERLGLGDKPAMLLGMKMLRMFDRVAIDFGHKHVDFHLAPKTGSPGKALVGENSAADALLR